MLALTIIRTNKQLKFIRTYFHNHILTAHVTKRKQKQIYFIKIKIHTYDKPKLTMVKPLPDPILSNDRRFATNRDILEWTVN